MSTLYRRIRFSAAAHEIYQQHCMFLLLAESDEPCYLNFEVDRKLVAAHQRGGLWMVKKRALHLQRISK